MFPVIKWVGGKRQLLPILKESLPKSFNKYYEPFVGGGALLFDVAPNKAIINDINKELIHTYQIIQKSPDELILQIQNLESQICDKPFYFQIRKQFNQKISNKEYDVELAALFIWINKHCFNGLYRVNKKGEFNVPYNGNDKVKTVDVENLLTISNYLKQVVILNRDFEDVFQDVETHDFIFFDSPYDNSFTGYSSDGFEEADHRRLAALFHNLSDKNCFCMLTNHDTPLIRELYSNCVIQEVDVRRAINRDGTNRQGKELIITNYSPKG